MRRTSLEQMKVANTLDIPYKLVRGTYNNFSRIGWALAVSWVIVANHLGWGGLIAKFMDHPLWQPLGRLSYCAYIVHLFVIYYVFDLDDRPFNLISMWQAYVYRAIPVVVLSYCLAFIWSCLFEIPTSILEKMLIATLTSHEEGQPMRSKPVYALSPDKRIRKNGDHIADMKF
ncbi:hypothetical protein KIN20_019156 [Parelaphostrongylus tenuis]|uniref:Acyltransferase 3 domain-containing protein n=1 Tax=Parelaphostrongylus tenuis TaxID=148309 RepID=A0AAD5MKZ5_PARTN|nr:hypothetical protein KIN20_019156 [Parelaphostrongylus tenuis]